MCLAALLGGGAAHAVEARFGRVADGVYAPIGEWAVPVDASRTYLELERE